MKYLGGILCITVIIIAGAGPAAATSFRWDELLPEPAPGNYMQINFKFDWQIGDPAVTLNTYAPVHIGSIEFYRGGTVDIRWEINISDYVGWITANTATLDTMGIVDFVLVQDYVSLYDPKPTLNYSPNIGYTLVDGEIGVYREYASRGVRVPTGSPPGAIPEPATLVLLGLGLVGLVAVRRKYRK
jgi:hypothetical protein